MIQLKDVQLCPARFTDLESGGAFATSCLACRSPSAEKRICICASDERAHTLCYSEGDPRSQTVGFESRMR